MNNKRFTHIADETRHQNEIYAQELIDYCRQLHEKNKRLRRSTFQQIVIYSIKSINMLGDLQSRIFSSFILLILVTGLTLATLSVIYALVIGVIETAALALTGQYTYKQQPNDHKIASFTLDSENKRCTTIYSLTHSGTRFESGCYENPQDAVKDLIMLQGMLSDGSPEIQSKNLERIQKIYSSTHNGENRDSTVQRVEGIQEDNNINRIHRQERDDTFPTLPRTDSFTTPDWAWQGIPYK